jgi:hypothetical protein
MSDSFVTRLEEAGYFRGLEPNKADALKWEFAQQGWMGIFAESHRFFIADAEDLAEGGIGEFIRQVKPFLEEQGVKVPEIHEEYSENRYFLTVGKTTHRIWDASELNRDTSSEQLGLMWGLAMTRGFRIVDQLLAGAGSSERLYAVNGGNDLFAFFLTPDLHGVIAEHPDASPEYGPYAPTEEYPWFGRPH